MARFNFLPVAAVVISTFVACSSDDRSSPPSPPSTSGADVLVAATYDGTTTTVVSVTADDGGPVTPAPYAGQPALRWSLDDASGKNIATGSIEDVTATAVEWASDGSAAPFFGHGQGFFEIRVPYVAGSTLSVSPAASTAQPTTPKVRPLGLCVNGSCPAATSPVTAPAPVPTASTVPGLKKILDRGPCAPFNVLLVAEGYQSSDMSSFESSAMAVATGFASYNGYSTHIQDFSFWVLEVPSTDSGITDPGCTPPGGGLYDSCDKAVAAVKRNTPFGTTYGDNTTEPRRLITFGAGQSGSGWSALAAAMRASRSDSVGILVNDPGNAAANYGGSGGRPWIAATLEGTYIGVATHESGHSIFGLQDEYDVGDADGTCASEAMTGLTSGRGPFPLVNVSNSASSPAWSSVQAGAPIEGAYYCTHGWYRAQTTCLMKELTTASGGTNNFCSVCLDHVVKTIAAKETFAACSCGGGADAGAEAGSADGGSLVTGGGALVCPTGAALVQQASAAGWYPF